MRIIKDLPVRSARLFCWIVRKSGHIAGPIVLVNMRNERTDPHVRRAKYDLAASAVGLCRIGQICCPKVRRSGLTQQCGMELFEHRKNAINRSLKVKKHALPLTYQGTADKLAAHGNAAGTNFKRILAQSINGIKLVQRYGGEGTCQLIFSRGAREAIALGH